MLGTHRRGRAECHIGPCADILAGYGDLRGGYRHHLQPVRQLPDLCGLFKASEDIPGGSRQLQAECGTF